MKFGKVLPFKPNLPCTTAHWAVPDEAVWNIVNNFVTQRKDLSQIVHSVNTLLVKKKPVLMVTNIFPRPIILPEINTINFYQLFFFLNKN